MPALNGPDCPSCGQQTLRAEFADDVMLRCVTDSCPKGWYDAE